MQRLVEFVQHYHLTVRLAYYPPYHSKYNPIERCWGHFGESLEWDLARFSGRGAPVCPDHDLERETSCVCLGDHHLSDGSQID
jgi:hypothetical protein